MIPDLEGISELSNDLKSSFQAGVDALHSKCVSCGATPSAKTPAAISTAIQNIFTNRYNAGYSAGNTAGYNSGYSAGFNDNGGLLLHSVEFATATSGYPYGSFLVKCINRSLKTLNLNGSFSNLSGGLYGSNDDNSLNKSSGIWSVAPGTGWAHLGNTARAYDVSGYRYLCFHFAFTSEQYGAAGGFSARRWTF